MSDENVIIVGAGVAGLSLSILLAKRNIESRVLESRQRFDGPTSGVRISSGGVKILRSLDVGSIGEATDEVVMHFGRISTRFTIPGEGASAIIATRLALHEQLLERALSSGVQVRTGFTIASAVESADGVEVTSESGERAKGRLLVGADGVGSVIRRVLNPGQGSTKRYAGYLGVGLITEDETKIEMTLLRYPGHQVGLASCGKVNGASRRRSVFMWTHIRMSEEDAKRATKESVEAELSRRSTLWSPELRSQYDLYLRDDHATLAFGPVYNGKPPPRWHSDRMMLIGDAAHPYGPGGQGISMALKDSRALCDVITRGFTDEDKREFQRSRAQEARGLGEAAEKRNAKEPSSSKWGVLTEGVLMKTVEVFTRGTMRF